MQYLSCIVQRSIFAFSIGTIKKCICTVKEGEGALWGSEAARLLITVYSCEMSCRQKYYRKVDNGCILVIAISPDSITRRP